MFPIPMEPVMSFPNRLIFAALLFASVFARPADAQTFDLIVPGSGLRSTAQLTADRLVIVDANGQASIYDRDPQLDANGYAAYSSQAMGQSIRWPLRGAGNMQVASLAGPLGNIAFRSTQMIVSPRGNGGLNPGVPGVLPGNQVGPQVAGNPSNDPKSVYVIESALGPGLLLSVAPLAGANVRIETQATGGQNVFFRLLPTDSGYVSIVPMKDRGLAIGMATGLAGNQGNAQLFDRRVGGGDAMQFRIVPDNAGFVTLELRANRDFVIDVVKPRGGRPASVGIFTRHGLQNQLFRLQRVGAMGNLPPSGFPPPIGNPVGPVLISKTVEPNPPLAPVQVQLSNSHANALWVLVTDLRDPDNSQRLKIPAGESRPATFERDPGSRVVSLLEVLQPNGVRVREESVVDVPPQPLYDISVYEMIPQSVYIDRTQPGSAPEVQHAPRSVGFFQVPATFEGGRSDVYRAAKRQNNSGGVRRLELKDWDWDEGDPEDAFSGRNSSR